MQAKAVVFPKANIAELRPIEISELRNDEILTKTLFTGISMGTETWVLTGNRDDVKFPCIPGYQNVGRVITVGSKVKQFKKGDLVMQAGFSRLPEGLHSGCGSCHSSHLIGNPKDAVLLDPKINKKEAALAWIAGCALEGNLLAKVGPKQNVLVIGQGLIGQMSAQIARAKGAHVWAAEVKPERIKLSRRYSADTVIDASKGDLVQLAQAQMPGGFDVVIEATGNKAMLDLATQLIRHRGKLCLQGWYPGQIGFHYHTPHMKEVTIVMPCAWGWQKGLMAIQKLLLTKKITIKPLITHLFPASKASQAYSTMLDKKASTLGMVIEWDL